MYRFEAKSFRTYMRYARTDTPLAQAPRPIGDNIFRNYVVRVQA